MGHSNYEYLKTSAQIEERKGDVAVEKSCFHDALHSYQNAKAQYEKMLPLNMDEYNINNLSKMNVENKINEIQKILQNKELVKERDLNKSDNNSLQNAGKDFKKAMQACVSSKSDDKSKIFPIVNKTGVKFDDIIGLEKAKNDIKEALYPTRDPDMAKNYKIKAGGFLILFGPPGTGKTSIAKAITTEFDADMIEVKSSDIYASLQGETEANIASLFKQANSNEKFTILYFDDGDTFFTRGNDHDGNQARYLNEWKTQFDGFAGRANTLIILSCNNPEILDSAILSRGTSKIYVELPNEDARMKIFEKELEGVLLDSSVNLKKLAAKTPMYSGRNIHNICEKACKSRFLKVVMAKEKGEVCKEEKVTQEDLLEAVNAVKPDVTERDIKNYEAIAERIAARNH